MPNWILTWDGLAEPWNPGGIATYGFRLSYLDKNAAEGKGLAATIGRAEATNNVAEYTALIKGLEAAKRLVKAPDDLAACGDSKLVVNQVLGMWSVNAPHLVGLAEQAKTLLREIRGAGCRVELKWIPREENAVADGLSRLAFLEALKSHPEEVKRLKIPWGKHAGKALGELPRDYLRWLCQRLPGDLIRAIEELSVQRLSPKQDEQ